VYIGQTC
jgi:group I intron endonuclease